MWRAISYIYILLWNCLWTSSVHETIKGKNSWALLHAFLKNWTKIYTAFHDWLEVYETLGEKTNIHHHQRNKWIDSSHFYSKHPLTSSYQNKPNILLFNESYYFLSLHKQDEQKTSKNMKLKSEKNIRKQLEYIPTFAKWKKYCSISGNFSIIKTRKKYSLLYLKNNSWRTTCYA